MGTASRQPAHSYVHEALLMAHAPSQLEVALAGAIGALGGSALSPLVQLGQDLLRARRLDAHRLQDVRRESYGDAVAWLLPLRDKIQSLSTFLLVADQETDSHALAATLEPLLREKWDEISGLVVSGFPDVMRPVMRVASDKIVAEYKEMVANSAFWHTFDASGDTIVDDDPTLLRLPVDEMIQEIQRRVRPMSRSEVIKHRCSSAAQYQTAVDSFVHRLRYEVGLSGTNDSSYLAFSPPTVPRTPEGEVSGRVRQLRARLRARHRIGS